MNFEWLNSKYFIALDLTFSSSLEYVSMKLFTVDQTWVKHAFFDSYNLSPRGYQFPIFIEFTIWASSIPRHDHASNLSIEMSGNNQVCTK